MLTVHGVAELVHGLLRLPMLGVAMGHEACRVVVRVQVGVVGLQVAQLIVVVGLLGRCAKAEILRRISHDQGQQCHGVHTICWSIE